MNLITLTIEEGPQKGTQFTPKGSSITLGRAPECDVVLDDGEVSRVHARIDIADGAVTFEDLGSRNGSYVDDKEVKSITLASGAKIRLGRSLILLDVHAAALVEPEVTSVSVMPEKHRAPKHQIDKQELNSVDGLPSLEPLLRLNPEQSNVGQFWTALSTALSESNALLSVLQQDQTPQVSASPHVLEVFQPQGHRYAGDVGQARAGIMVRQFSWEGKMRNAIEGYLNPENPKRDRFMWVPNFTRSFSAQERAHLHLLGQHARVLYSAIESGHKKRILEKDVQLFSRFVPEDVLESTREKMGMIDTNLVSGQERHATVLFSDIKGFTSMCERLSASEVADLLNAYFSRMVNAIEAYNGSINKFIGDAIMAVFGAPRDDEDQGAHAVKAGLAMIQELKAFQEMVPENKRFDIRIGINTGKMIAGHMGSQTKMEYTVLGDEVNVASRIEGIATPNTVTVGLNTAVLINETFDLREREPIKVKGKSAPIKVFEVRGPKAAK